MFRGCHETPVGAELEVPAPRPCSRSCPLSSVANGEKLSSCTSVSPGTEITHLLKGSWGVRCAGLFSSTSQ